MTTNNHDDVAENLAFLKSLVNEGGQAEMAGGQAFFAAGILYGLQCLLQWASAVGILPLSTIGHLIVGLGPTIAFIIVIIWITVRNKARAPKGVATRALNAAYSSAGLANMFIVAVFGTVAIQEKSFLIWALYPVVLCAFQGAVWYSAYMIRKKLWLAGVSAGWFATTLALGFLIRTPHYILVLAIALFVLMGGAGYVMMRSAKT